MPFVWIKDILKVQKQAKTEGAPEPYPRTLLKDAPEGSLIYVTYNIRVPNDTEETTHEKVPGTKEKEKEKDKENEKDKDNEGEKEKRKENEQQEEQQQQEEQKEDEERDENDRPNENTEITYSEVPSGYLVRINRKILN